MSGHENNLKICAWIINTQLYKWCYSNKNLAFRKSTQTPNHCFEALLAPPHQDENSCSSLRHAGSIVCLSAPAFFPSFSLTAASADPESATVSALLGLPDLPASVLVLFTLPGTSSPLQTLSTLPCTPQAAGFLSPPTAPEFCYYSFYITLKFSRARTRTEACLSLFPGPGKQ